MSAVMLFAVTATLGFWFMREPNSVFPARGNPLKKNISFIKLVYTIYKPSPPCPFEVAPMACLPTLKSPKSVASPAEERAI